MSTEETLIGFIGERWRIAKVKNKAPKNPMRFITSMQTDGWRPVTADNPVAAAPSSINSLIERCCSADQRARPSFREVLLELNGPCATEVSVCSLFKREPCPAVIDLAPPFERVASAASLMKKQSSKMLIRMGMARQASLQPTFGDMSLGRMVEGRESQISGEEESNPMFKNRLGGKNGGRKATIELADQKKKSALLSCNLSDIEEVAVIDHEDELDFT